MSIAVLYMMLLLAIATIGTVTGWLAVVQIRKSRGAIRGMRLALFAGLTFPLLVLDAVLHAAAKAFFHPWMTAGSTQSVILSRLIILLLIILDIVIIRGIWRTINPSPLASSDQAAPPTRPASAPPSRKSWGWFTTILVLHTIAWVAATVFLVKIVPHFMQIFDEVACNLPEATTHTIDISQFVLHGGFLLIPVLLAADFGICWLLQARASRKLLIAWGMTSLLALIGVLALGIFVIVFPYQAIVKEMSHGTSPSLKENSQTSSKNQQTSGEPTVSFDPAAGLRLIQEAPFTAKLPVGRVELVALARTPKSPVNPETWWRPNGMTWNGTFQGLSNWSFEKSGRENKDIFDLAFTVHDNPNQPSKLIIKFPPNSGVLNGRTSAEWLNDQRFPFLFRQRLACDPGTKTVDMLVFN